jgi:hypothetical protein
MIAQLHNVMLCRIIMRQYGLFHFIQDKKFLHCHDITEILLKVALNTITLTLEIPLIIYSLF